jgi:hypothetical protein
MMDLVDVLSLEAEANVALGYIMAAQVSHTTQHQPCVVLDCIAQC